MENPGKWRGMGWLIATVGLAVLIIAESPEQTIINEWDYELGMAIFNIGIMGRALASAIHQKPDIMDTRSLVYTWIVPLAATFVIGIKFVNEGYLQMMEAVLVIIALGSAYSFLVGEIEERDDDTFPNDDGQ